MSVAITLHVKTMAHALTISVPTRAAALKGGRMKTVQKVGKIPKKRFDQMLLFCKKGYTLYNVLIMWFIFKISTSVTVIPLVSIMGRV